MGLVINSYDIRLLADKLIILSEKSLIYTFLVVNTHVVTLYYGNAINLIIKKLYQYDSKNYSVKRIKIILNV